MSSLQLAENPYGFSQQGTFPAPYELDIPASLVLQADTATATYDGTGAAGSFLPCLSFYSPAGVLIGSVPIQTATLQPGDTAEVSWFPFAPAAISGGGGAIESSDHSLVIASPAPGVTDATVRRWARANPIMYDTSTDSNFGAAFYHTDVKTWGITWLLLADPYADPDGGKGSTLMGNAYNYVVQDASLLSANTWGMPPAGSVTSAGTGPYMPHPQNIVGQGLAVNASSEGVVWPFWFVFTDASYMQMMLANGAFIDNLTPFLWQPGDWLSGSWVTSVLEYD